MTPSIFQLAISFGIPLILSIISSIIPEVMSEESKIRLFKSSLDTSIILLRSQGFEATYDEMDINFYNDLIEIKNINIRKQFEPYDLPFCDAEKIKKKSIWQDETCELVIKIQNLQFKGLNFIEKNDNFFEINANNINFDTSIFNDSSSKTAKKLFEIENTIIASFSIKNIYNFNKNIFENNIYLDIHNFGNLNLETKLTNLLYNQEKFSAVLDKFNLGFTNNGILKKIDTFIDIESDTNLIEITNNNLKTKSLLNIENESEIKVIEDHNKLIKDVSRHYPNFNKNIDNIFLFLENPDSIKCIRNEEHLMNENVFDAIEDAGPTLLFAIFCENIVINDPI